MFGDALVESVGAATSAQVLTLLVSSVTAPLRASARPVVLVPVVTVMLESARISPANVLPVPSVAEVPTCQYTLSHELPLMAMTVEPLAVVSVLPVLNTNCALGLFCTSSVSVPVNCAEVLKQ